DDLFVGKTLLHGDVLMWLMKTLLTSGCTNQRGAGHALESQITNSIATATVQLREALMKYAEADSSAVNYPIISKNYNSAQETWLNAYDQACMSYREGKLNKETFKKTYHVPIRELYEDKELQFFFSPADTSKYQSIISVYREWETYHR
ncbi:hypothetical protein, partial [Klebsiella variicola]|uniref:hypothetical protein n=2 Tax=Klebsiella variicola TaxID=244366 RepID=UPI001962F0E5